MAVGVTMDWGIYIVDWTTSRWKAMEAVLRGGGLLGMAAAVDGAVWGCVCLVLAMGEWVGAGLGVMPGFWRWARQWTGAAETATVVVLGITGYRAPSWGGVGVLYGGGRGVWGGPLRRWL